MLNVVIDGVQQQNIG